jgi:hypothetical protein
VFKYRAQWRLGDESTVHVDTCGIFVHTTFAINLVRSGGNSCPVARVFTSLVLLEFVSVGKENKDRGSELHPREKEKGKSGVITKTHP